MPFSLTTTALRVGTNSISAKVFDNLGATATSSVRQVVVAGGQFANPNVIVINDNTSATPNPSEISIDGLTGLIANVTVVLDEIHHTYPDDINILLVGPSGQNTILLADIGSSTDLTGETYTISDSAAGSLADEDYNPSGTYRPTNGGSANDYFLSPAPTGPHTASLAVFVGTTPNGIWKLFILDDEAGASGAISNGWQLVIGTASSNSVPTVVLNASATNISSGQPVTLNATATDANGTIAKVEFFNGATKLGEDLTPPFGLVVHTLPEGTNNITAKATDNVGFGATSAAVQVVADAGGIIGNGNQIYLFDNTGANPYPSEISVSGLSGVVGSVEVVLNGVYHAYPDDLNVLLVGPSGQNTILMADVGGGTALGSTTYTIADSATALLADDDVNPPGRYRPTNGGGSNDSFGSPAPVGPHVASLAVFNETSPNGIWKLYVEDDSPGNSGGISNGWQLVFTTVSPFGIPTVSLSSSATNIASGQQVTLTATAEDADGTIVKVEFYNGPTRLAEDTNSPFTLSITNLPAGANSLTARATDDLGFSTTSAPISIVVASSGTSASTFANTGAISITDSPGSSPYPSTISVSGLTGVVTSVSVTLSNLSHTWPDDIDVLLVGPAGQSMVLVSDAGGGADLVNATFAFADTAAGTMAKSALNASGGYRPTDYESGDTFPSPAPSGPYGQTLSVFNGAAPNGTWSLYVVDDATGDSGSLAGGWSLSISTGTGAANPPAAELIALADVEAVPGSTASFIPASHEFYSTLFSGESFQWYFNSNAISGETSGWLILNHVEPADTGVYHAIFTSNGVQRLTQAARLTVPNRGVNEAWRRYSNMTTNSKVTAAMTVDSSGNTHVLGTELSGDSIADNLEECSPFNRYCRFVGLVIEKRNSVGSLLFSKRYYREEYNFSIGDYSGRWVEGRTIDLDSQGNSIVGATTDALDARELNLLLLKYDPSGDLVWERTFNGVTDDDDELTDVAIGPADEVVAVGSSICGGVNRDILIVKYDRAGELQWFRSYDGPAGGSDSATAATIDPLGNVYVCGVSPAEDGREDFVVLKYGADGSELWTRRWNGPAGLRDVATALAVDSSGNVLVTGWSESNASSRQIVIVKYDAGGALLWVARHLDSSSAMEQPVAMTVLADGSTVVTGATLSLESRTDFLTIKYDSAGYRVWAARHGGPNTDRPVGLAADGDGNVYVTGLRTVMEDRYSPIRDFATVKYDSAGNEIWTAGMNTSNQDDVPKGVGVDLSGNVYVAGYTVEDNIFTLRKTREVVVVKYAQSEAMGAARITTTPTGTNVDQGTTIVLTSVATGQQPLSLQWYRDGEPLAGETNSTLQLTNMQGVHTGHYRVSVSNSLGKVLSPLADVTVNLAPAITVQPAGQVQMVAGGELTLRVFAEGLAPLSHQWLFDGTNIDSATNSSLVIPNIQSANAGNYQVIITNTLGSVTSAVSVVSVSTAGGSLLGEQRIPFPASRAAANLMATDPLGLLFMAVDITETDASKSSAVLKLTPSGDLIWSNYLANVVLTGIAGDTTGGAIVCGWEQPTRNGHAIVVARYSSAGSLVWRNSFSEDGKALGIALNTTGHANIVALTDPPPSTTAQTSVDRFSVIQFGFADGAQRWANHLNVNPFFSPEDGFGIAVDGSDNVVAVGSGLTNTSFTFSSHNDFITRKLDSNGNLQWSRILDGGSEGDDIARRVAVDAGGNIFVAGEMEGTSNRQLAVAKYDSAGAHQGTVKYAAPGAASRDARLYELQLDATGNVYLHGNSPGALKDDIVTVKFTSSLTEVWAKHLTGASAEHGIGGDLLIDSSGNIFMAGSVSNSASGLDWAIAALNASGQGLWTNYYNGTGNGTDRALALAPLPGNGLIAGGELSLPFGESELGLIRLGGTDSGSNSPPIISISSPGSGSEYLFPTNVGFTVQASDPQGNLERVDYFAGATLIGTSTNAPFPFTWSNAVAGGHAILARATDSAGAVAFSRPIRVDVNTPVVITTPPVGTNVSAFERFTLNVAVSGTGLRYQWRINGANIPGATNRTYTVEQATTADGGAYAVVVANAISAVTSPEVIVRVGGTGETFADNFANAGTIGSGLRRGTNTTATAENGEPKHAGKPGGKSVWLKYTATISGLVTVNTRGSAFDTLLGVYTRGAGGSLTAVASDDDSGGFLTSTLVFDPTPGQTYYIAVDGYGGGGGRVCD